MTGEAGSLERCQGQAKYSDLPRHQIRSSPDRFAFKTWVVRAEPIEWFADEFA